MDIVDKFNLRSGKMATIVKRNKNYSVIYYYKAEDGKRKQKWEAVDTYKEALQRKAEIEYLKAENIFPAVKTGQVKNSIKSIEMYMEEFVSSYGKKNWSISTYSSNKSLLGNYIYPYIGKIPVHIITTEQIDEYYDKLSENTIISRVHKLLKCAFGQALKLKLIKENPFCLVDLPKSKYVQKSILTAEQIKMLLNYCYKEDYQLYICINFAFACSMRLGEVLGLTWDDVEISDKSIENNNSCVRVNKTLTRANYDTLKELNHKDVIYTFEPQYAFKKSRLVLKTPKTASSHRTIWLPATLAGELSMLKNSVSSNFYLFNQFTNRPKLVFVNSQGQPVDIRTIEERFKEALINCNLPQVTFHSLRHSSITYKLLLSKGDIKSVQGDSGHSQIHTTMNIYAHILDEERKKNAQNFDNYFYVAMQ